MAMLPSRASDVTLTLTRASDVTLTLTRASDVLRYHAHRPDVGLLRVWLRRDDLR